MDYTTLWQHGCFGQLRPFRHGRGEPVDVFDKVYKEYQTCRACVKYDFGPKFEQISRNYSFCYDFRKRRFLCPKEAERNSVEQWSQCECDAKLANHLATLTDKLTARKEFDFDADCQPNPDRVKRSLPPTCCGVYPKRYVK